MITINRIYEKVKLKIRSKRSEMLILSEDKNDCRKLNAKIQRASTELGKNIEVKVISDKAQMAAFGVVNGRRRFSVNYKLKSEVGEPSLDVVKEWIKEL